MHAHIIQKKAESKADLPLSVSKVKTFEDCKAKYKYNYIEKLPRKTWDFHVFGQFVHAVLEDYHKEVMEGTTEWPHEIMSRAFNYRRKRYKSLKPPQIKEGWEIVNNYLKQISSHHPNVMAVERHFYIDVDQSVLVNGFIDRIDLDDDGILHVADYKITKNKKYLKDFFQLITYAWLLMLEDPSIEMVRGSFILLRHNSEWLTREIRREDVEIVSEKYLKRAAEIRTEKLWRTSPSPLCNFCDFLSNCKDGRQFVSRLGKNRSNPTPLYGKQSW